MRGYCFASGRQKLLKKICSNGSSHGQACRAPPSRPRPPVSPSGLLHFPGEGDPETGATLSSLHLQPWTLGSRNVGWGWGWESHLRPLALGILERPGASLKLEHLQGNLHSSSPPNLRHALLPSYPSMALPLPANWHVECGDNRS